MFAEPSKSRPAIDYACSVCGANACYGLGPPAVPAQNERWFCQAHVPDGFLPKDRAA